MSRYLLFLHLGLFTDFDARSDLVENQSGPWPLGETWDHCPLVHVSLVMVACVRTGMARSLERL